VAAKSLHFGYMMVPAQEVEPLEPGANERAGDYWFAAMQLNSVRKPPPEFKSGRTRRRSGGCFPIRKLSNKLSTHNWAHSANHRLARQVHQRHVLTL
jgi:hypothetical protein